MYIPLNAAIIVEIFRDCHSDSLLPHTLTDLYTQLCLTILNRFLQLEHPFVNVFQFNNLPTNLFEHFLKLSAIAFEGIKNEHIIFHSVNPDTVHFGFFDAVSSLYGGGRVSYNFLHLTLQEFFAAYHISQLSGEEACVLVKEYSCDTRWTIIWRFLAGLTKFKYLNTHVTTCSINYEERAFFGSVNQLQEFDMSRFLIQCLYEAKVQMNFGLEFEAKKCNALVDIAYWTPLDAFALGCSICIDSTNLPWSVTFWCSESQGCLFYTLKLDYFLCGMNKSKTEGVINELIIRKCEFDITKLKHLIVLRLSECKLNDTDLIHLSELIPHMTCLRTLDIGRNNLFGVASSGIANAFMKCFHSAMDFHNRKNRRAAAGQNLISEVFEPLRHDFSAPCTDLQQDGLLRVLQNLIHSNVTSLSIVKTGFCHLLKNSPHDYYSALERLIDPSSGKLKTISFGDYRSAGDRLMTLVSSPSSLKNLLLFPSYPLTCLETNTCLTTLKLHVLFLWWAIFTPWVVGILKNNKVLRFMLLSNFDVTFDRDMENLKDIISALHENKTLCSMSIILDGDPLYFHVASDYMMCFHDDMTDDRRINWYPEENILSQFQGLDSDSLESPP